MLHIIAACAIFLSRQQKLELGSHAICKRYIDLITERVVLVELKQLFYIG